MLFDIGRVCIKTAGREAGCYCVILKKMEEKYVLVTGPKELTRVRRRKCNINHLEPLMEKIKISQEAPDSEVLRTLEKDSVLKRLGLGKPDLVKIKALKTKKEKGKADIRKSEEGRAKEERPKEPKKEKSKEKREKSEKPKKEKTAKPEKKKEAKEKETPKKPAEVKKPKKKK